MRKGNGDVSQPIGKSTRDEGWVRREKDGVKNFC
jgi:hypothetical protein